MIPRSSVMIDKENRIHLISMFNIRHPEVSFHFLPSGVVIKDGHSTSDYSYNTYQKTGIIHDEALYEGLKKRGFTPDKMYPLIYLQDGYYPLPGELLQELPAYEVD